MSRIVSYSSAITLNPTAFTASNTGYTTNGNNGCTNSASTTYATLACGRRTHYYTSYSFNTESIPQGATINSVNVYGKAHVDGTGGTYIGSAATYANSTQKSNTFKVSATTTNGGPFLVSGGTWTYSDLASLNLWLNHPYGGNNRNMQFYGADAVISYTVQGTEYEISFNNQSEFVTTDPSTTQYVLQGGNQEIKFLGIDSLSDVNIKDNNTVINSSLVLVTEGTTHYKYTISNIANDHIISIEDVGVTSYIVNASSTYTGATVSPSTQTIREGRSATVNIDVNNLYEIRVKDNNVDVTSSVSAPQESETSNFPTSNFVSTASTYDSLYSSSYPTSNGENSNSASTTYTRVYANTAANSESRLVYKFNCSSIPENAIIERVTCIVRGYVSSTTYLPTRYAQLFYGDTAKGSQSTNFGTSNGTVTISDGGTWTREELDDIRVAMIVRRGNSTNSANFRFYGATLLVTYYIPASYTITNVQTAHTIVVEQAPTYAISVSSTYTGATITTSQSTVYQGRGTTLTLSVNNLYEVVVKDNGTDITSNFTGSNGTYRYGLSNIQTAHTIVVEEAPYYYVDASSTNTGLTAQPSQQKVYAGRSATVTFNGNFSDTKVVDNGIDVTSQLVVVNTNTRTYTLQNVSTGHTVVISKRVNYAKVGGVFTEIKKYFIKVNGEWSAMTLTEFVTNNVNDIHMYGGHISGVVTTIVGEVVNDSNDTYIEISDNALPSGTYKLIYEDENRHTLQDIDKITEFTIN